MSTITITKAAILRYASAETFRHGQSCYQQGAVIAPALYGTRLLAEVKEEAPVPEFVCCTFQADGSIAATCTCQSVWGGWCKHMVASCLVLLYHPENVEERPALEHMLEHFSHDELQAFVITVAGQIPHLAEAIEKARSTLEHTLAQATTTSAAPAQAPRTKVDTRAIRRQVRSAIHSLDRMGSSEAYWQVSSVVSEVEHIAEQALELLEAGDGHGALATLEAVTEEYRDEWENLDDSDGYAGELFRQLGQLWAEVLLRVELSQKERKTWAEKLTAWQGEVEAYGVDDAFDIAVTAALQGWNYPPLRRILQGSITGQGIWDGERPSYAEDLTRIRLTILEQQERMQEYLFLAKAEGQTEAYLWHAGSPEPRPGGGCVWTKISGDTGRSPDPGESTV